MSLKAIREALGSKTDQFPMRTVIRWTSGERYTYVVVKTPNGWYHSGSVNAEHYVGRNPITFDDLLEILKDDRVTDIEIATHWEPIKPADVSEDEPQAKRAPRHIPKENFSRDPDEEPSYYGDEGDVGFGGSGEHV